MYVIGTMEKIEESESLSRNYCIHESENMKQKRKLENSYPQVIHKLLQTVNKITFDKGIFFY
ncbi:hypothetical protein DL897_12605 [Thermoflavimicrobium daqui]|uniref:Uncharacterized protein n=1 Tax=Thermoflavimicrobium daqui TaxID=2137476 RepID=A0A364K2Y7_9BACL|nr:hypothetical protein DL897_12605 [Thermoflavimicrobium daqui]